MFSVETDFPIAFDSLDHAEPKGTKDDCFRNVRFAWAVQAHFKDRRPLRVLDLGCAGGCSVEDFVMLGHEAVGLEGSDYSLKEGREAWGRIPGHLFTCDISRPFHVKDGDGGQFRADVVTSWDCFEHVPEERTGQLLLNLVNHLKHDGLVLLNIPDVDAVEPYHVNLKPRGWWDALFARYGFRVSEAGLGILARERVRSGYETCYAYEFSR